MVDRLRDRFKVEPVRRVLDRPGTYYGRKVRHEALFDRVEVRDLHLRPVAAGRMKPGAA